MKAAPVRAEAKAKALVKSKAPVKAKTEAKASVKPNNLGILSFTKTE